MDNELPHTIEDEHDEIQTVSDVAEHSINSEHSEVASGAQSPAEIQLPSVASPLQILFSVYTATNGYDWSNIPAGSDREGLDFYYQKAVERKPDFMTSGDVVKGVFARDGNIAAFRIQVVKHWDSFGRNADYCAFAFLTYEEACRVDFDTLLEMPEFTDPRHDPPTSIWYYGEASKDINSEESVVAIKKLYRGASLQSFDFGKIGALLSMHGNKSASWLFCKVECAIENSTTVSTGTWNTDPYPPPSPPLESSQLQPQAGKVVGPLQVATQQKEVVEPSVVTQTPQIRPLTSPPCPQVAPRTVVGDACLCDRIPARTVQKAVRPLAAGHIRSARGNTCVMTPVSLEEINRSTAQASNGLFGLDTPTLVLFSVCAVLFAILLIILFCFGMSAVVVDTTKKIDAPQIKSLGDINVNPRIDKGGK